MNRRGVFEAFLPGTELASRENDRTDARGASENGRSNGEIGEFDGGVGGAVPGRAETAETGDVVVERRRRARLVCEQRERRAQLRRRRDDDKEMVIMEDGRRIEIKKVCMTS